MNVLEKILEEIEEKMILVATSKEHYDQPQNGKYVEEVITIRDVENIIRSHMDHSGDDTEMGDWIPVEERLPEEKGDITKDFNLFKESLHLITDGVNVTIALFDGGYFRCYDDYVPYTDVKAWQPLPEPYKPKKATAAGMEHIMSRFMKTE